MKIIQKFIDRLTDVLSSNKYAITIGWCFTVLVPILTGLMSNLYVGIILFIILIAILLVLLRQTTIDKEPIFCAECGHPLYRRVYSNGNRVNWGCSGQRRYTKTFCPGINVPDYVIRDWGAIPGNIYIRKEVDKIGKAKFKYVRESTWKKSHKKKENPIHNPAITEENYPYKKYLHCAGCGSVLTRHTQGSNKKIFWICSGYKHKGKAFCSGVRVPDDVVRRAAAKITQNIYIRKGNEHGETGYSYTSNWKRQNQEKEQHKSE